ncbi:MAG: tetratricopeptide repeat protein [Rhodothermales bacterium]|nr:tetratricopeptide repeat protein [Rhodothermales bacterium]MBO6780791.1 tetratricopeptide repeat protein [Rhodothermales bacterium]
MSTLNPTRKISRKQELREDKVVTVYARLLEASEKYRTYFIGAGAAIVLLVLATIAWTFMQSANQREALDAMAGAVNAYEDGSYQTALDGTGNFLGLLDVVDEYGGTDAGNLARFYAADSYFRLGNYEEALPLFREFDRDGNLLGASATAAEAAILESQGEYDRAASLYNRAATMYPSDATSPGYFMSAGRAFEAAGETSDARRAYERVRDDYPESQEARDIDFYLARVSG